MCLKDWKMDARNIDENCLIPEKKYAPKFEDKDVYVKAWLVINCWYESAAKKLNWNIMIKIVRLPKNKTFDEDNCKNDYLCKRTFCLHAYLYDCIQMCGDN